jgi:hypothetical protein
VNAGDGRHVLLGDPDGSHQLWFVGDITRGSSFIIPHDDDVAARKHAIDRLKRHLAGQRAGPLMRSQQLSPHQRMRLTLQLRALDGQRDGATRREIAAVLLDPQARDLPAIEWKNAALRKRINRMLASAQRMVGGGYLALLRGDIGRATRFSQG